MNDRVIIQVLSVLAGALLIGVFLLTHERVEIDSYTPPSGEAKLNPVLAAERLLYDLGYNVASEVEFAPGYRLPASGDTALLVFDYGRLQKTDLDMLLDWVAGGGHLVVEIQPDFGRGYDPIFTPLDIVVVEPRLSIDNPDKNANSGDDDSQEVVPVDIPMGERYPQRDYWGDMSIDNQRHIDFGSNETIWTVADEDGVFAGQIAYDKGLLTVVSELGFLTNARIGEQDHAYILTRLIGDPSESGKIWLYYGRSFPTLWNIVWDKADFLIKAGLLIFLLILWRAGGTLGPNIPAPSQARKAFLEHVSANGRFLWRKHQQAMLVSKTHASFFRDFERRHPASRHLSAEQRRRLLADICDMPEEKVDNALRPLRGRSHHDFMEKMQLLRTLWMRI